jgi:hypothetical protein
MGREGDVFQRRQDVAGRQGLSGEDIETGVADMTRAQRLDHGLLVDQRAARRVH